MDSQKIYKAIAIIVGIIILFLGGFFAGKYSVKITEKVVTEYVEKDPIHDTVQIVKPEYVIRPADTLNILKKCIEDGIYSELFPKKIITDTIVFTNEDTTEVLKDWSSERHYTNTLFDIDTVGKCVINTEIQYNRMSYMDYTFTPIQKTTTIVKEKKQWVSGFVGAGWISSPAIQATAGIYIKDHYGIGFNYQYNYLQNNNSFGGTLLYKF